MPSALHNYLNDPIPRKIALAVTIGQAIGTFVVLSAYSKDVKKTMEGRDEAIRILQESTNFLLDRADDRTIEELNEKLDYWRVVLDMPIETMSNHPDTDEN